MKSASFALLAFIASSAVVAAPSDSHVFSPSNCEFSTTFPMVPQVGEHRNPSSGRQSLQATSPGDGLPWLIAQCTTGDDGSAPPDVKDRLERVRSTLVGRSASEIRTSTKHDARGDWATATGDIVIQGIPLTMTTTSVAGQKSMLLLTVIRTRASDSVLVDSFFGSVARHPETPAR
jgi:hypothetical protein